MKTKALVRLLNRLAHFDADLELADIFGRAVRKRHLDPRRGEHLFAHLDGKKHKRLRARESNSHNRKLAANHLRNTLSAAYLKDLHEEVGAYFTDLLAAAARAGLDPDRLIGENKLDLTANEVLKCGSWDRVVQLVGRRLFRRLEDERSTEKLLIALDKKLDLGADASLRTAALPFFEIRHLLVHSDGVADEAFCRRYPQFGATVGERIDLTLKLVSDARAATFAMVADYDGKAVAKLNLLPEDTQP